MAWFSTRHPAIVLLDMCAHILGHLVKIPKGMMVLQTCELAGVDIPRFCYHSRLSITRNCRMCLVEVEKSPKPMASYSMPALHGNLFLSPFSLWFPPIPKLLNVVGGYESEGCWFWDLNVRHEDKDWYSDGKKGKGRGDGVSVDESSASLSNLWPRRGVRSTGSVHGFQIRSQVFRQNKKIHGR